MTLAVPTLEPVMALAVFVGAPVDVGPGRRVVPILGGSVSGLAGTGRILPGGADFQVIHPDGLTELQARYVIALDDGALVYVENNAVRFGSPEALARLRRGEPVEPGAIYFRGTPRFETDAPALSWLRHHLFLASGIRRPDQVELSVFKVT